MLKYQIPGQGYTFKKSTGTSEPVSGQVKPLFKKVEHGHPDSFGHYCSNNGVLAVVDGNLDVWVGKMSPEAVSALESAGFVEGSFYVPYSSGGHSTLEKIFRT